MELHDIFEAVMVVSFGASWPFNVMKSFKARTAKGKSPLFLILILFGYVAGITAKFMNAGYMAEFGKKWYILIFYFLNFIMVAIDFVLYLRNRALDKKAEAAVAGETCECDGKTCECNGDTCECNGETCECNGETCECNGETCECVCKTEDSNDKDTAE